MALGIGRGMTAPLMVVNFCLYLIAASLAGSVLNRNLDGGHGRVGNNVTSTFLLFSLIASVVGMASVFAGAHHVRVWRTESLAAAAATSLIAWLLTLLAMGVACKEIHIGYGRNKRLTSEMFMIILSLFELLYLVALHAGAVFGEGYAFAGTLREDLLCVTEGTFVSKSAHQMGRFNITQPTSTIMSEASNLS